MHFNVPQKTRGGNCLILATPVGMIYLSCFCLFTVSQPSDSTATTTTTTTITAGDAGDNDVTRAVHTATWTNNSLNTILSPATTRSPVPILPPLCKFV